MAVIQGIENLESQLNKLERAVRRKLLTDLFKESVEPTRALAAATAPYRSGTSRREQIISVGRALSTSSSVVIRVGPSMRAFYDLFSEVGTAHSTANPFLGPAYEATKDKVLENMTVLLVEAIKEI